MPKINLSHFEAAFVFALLTSVVMGITTKKTQKEQINYGAYCFGCFLAALFGIAWVMKLGHG